MTIKATAADLIARATNLGLATLRNKDNLRLTRDEFRDARISFSLFGEDLAVIRWLDRFPETPAIYVDAGCGHPVHHSNTLLLYKKGWRGLNVDMNEKTVATFAALRPNDINVTAALSDRERDMVLFGYAADEPTIIDRLGDPAETSVPWLDKVLPVRSMPARTRTLISIMSGLPFERIGYLNIDCEGHDLEVLKGFDLDRHRPTVVTVEAHKSNKNVRADTIEHMTRCGYSLEEILEITLLFVRCSSCAFDCSSDEWRGRSMRESASLAATLRR